MKKLFFCILWIVAKSSAEIGIRLISNGDYVPKSSNDTATKINGNSFEIYCSTGTEYRRKRVVNIANSEFRDLSNMKRLVILKSNFFNKLAKKSLVYSVVTLVMAK